jgi:hypothetical protein
MQRPEPNHGWKRPCPVRTLLPEPKVQAGRNEAPRGISVTAPRPIPATGKTPLVMGPRPMQTER